MTRYDQTNTDRIEEADSGRRKPGLRTGSSVSRQRRQVPRSRSRRVLIGMTHAQRRADLARALRAKGHRVVVAKDGYHLIRLMSGAVLDESGTVVRPDLIIADMAMPGASGMSILDGVRGLHWDTPVFLLVDFFRPESVNLAIDHGANRVFEKPISTAEVCAAVDEFLPAAEPAILDVPH